MKIKREGHIKFDRFTLQRSDIHSGSVEKKDGKIVFFVVLFGSDKRRLFIEGTKRSEFTCTLKITRLFQGGSEFEIRRSGSIEGVYMRIMGTYEND